MEFRRVVFRSPWEIEGVVEQGDQRGRTIGFPTANLRLGPLMCPRLGVYAVRAALADGEEAGEWMAGVANLGVRPTVNDRGVLLEVHLFDRTLERSEEHTSELQSLMRISYAVFCLKKKNR